ncbi:MAG TPA: hypothetical protein VG898_07115, partial [Solirubrobacterales bacterium]|nr:hypothetical protein [Solirubrobacterales bacterium]
MKLIRNWFTYANVMSTIAVFLLIGGGAAFAAINLPKNSVGSKQLKKSSVDSSKVKDHSLKAADFKAWRRAQESACSSGLPVSCHRPCHGDHLRNRISMVRAPSSDEGASPNSSPKLARPATTIRSS